jgi:hypothetical protein
MRVTLKQVEEAKSKDQARSLAIDWQKQAGLALYTTGELIEYSNAFAKVARRFGLVREFKENGII